jgi:AcrR family transcriptional regulator
MPTIAAKAGVVVETIYRAFGSKASLFRAVIEAVLAGGASRAEVPVEQRPAIRAVIDEPDSRRQVDLYAATQPGIHRRAGPLLRALASARGSDAELDQLWRQMEDRRFEGQSRFVGMLADRGALRPGLPIDQARDVVWTLCSLAVHDLFVLERGWSAERYRAWLSDALARELLPDAGRGS